MKSEKTEKVTVSVYLRDHEVKALLRSADEMNFWNRNNEKEERNYDLWDAAKWALYDGIRKLMEEQRRDDFYSRRMENEN